MNVGEFKTTLLKKGMAFSNRYRVILPPIAGAGIQGNDLNILCKQASLPGKQILSEDVNYGLYRQKVAYGYAVDDVSLTFHMTNDYAVKKYFEAWAKLAVNTGSDNYLTQIGYKTDYANDVTIEMLDKETEETVYTCKLYDAYPTTLNTIEISNELDGLVEFNVQLSYRHWSTE
jgi:hypothetical protein